MSHSTSACGQCCTARSRIASSDSCVPCAFSRSAARRHKSRLSGNTRSAYARIPRAAPTLPRDSALSASPTHVSNLSSSSTSIATVALMIASHVRGDPSVSHRSASFSHWSRVRRTWWRRSSRTPISIVLSTAPSSFSRSAAGLSAAYASCSSSRPAAIQMSCEVGTALRALFRTALAFSGVSRRARPNHNSTESGITSTARDSKIRASDADDSRLTVSFHSRTEFGMCSRASDNFSDGSSYRKRNRVLTFSKHALLCLDVMF